MKHVVAIVFGFCLILSVSCSKDKSNSSGQDTDCLVGTWEFTEDNFVKSFTFNSNNTGVEVQAANDIRNFTWSFKNNKPVIVYVNETNEWEFELDCEKNELTIFFAVYKK